MDTSSSTSQTPASTTTVTTAPHPTIAGATVVTTTTTIKPWWKSVESYVAGAACVMLSGLYVQGVISPTGTDKWSQIAAVIGFALTSAGFSISRGIRAAG